MLDYLLDNTFRWILILSVFIMNFFVYYYDPDRRRNALCFKISCKWFAYINAMVRYTINIFILLGTIFLDGFNIIWFLPVIVLGYAIMTQIAIDTPDIVEEKIRPPDYKLSKNSRLILLAIVMLLNIIIFVQLYVASRDCKLKLVVEWLAILIILTNVYGIYANRIHKDCVYN